MGLGKILLGRFRERRAEVILKINYNAAIMMNAVLRNPGAMPLALVGMVDQQGVPRLYRPTKEEAKRIRSVRKVFETDLMTGVVRDKFDNVTAGEFQDPKDVKEFRLSNTYVKTLETALKHYEPVCSNLDWTDRYVALESALSGKDCEKEYDDLEDVRGNDKAVVENKTPVDPDTGKKSEKSA